MQLTWLIHHTEHCLFPPSIYALWCTSTSKVCVRACGVGLGRLFSSHPSSSSVSQGFHRQIDWLTTGPGGGGAYRVIHTYYGILYVRVNFRAGVQSKWSAEFWSSSSISRFMIERIECKVTFAGRLCIVTDYMTTECTLHFAPWTWIRAYILLSFCCLLIQLRSYYYSTWNGNFSWPPKYHHHHYIISPE